MTNKAQIEIRTSPHAHSGADVVQIMRTVALALLPLAGWGVWRYGLSAALLLLTTLLGCLLAERLFNRMRGQPSSLGDWSAVITGLLLGLSLPPGFPLWMGLVAAFAAIGLGKALFGGLGMNPLNPALVGRAFVQAAFPAAITTWTPALFDGRFTNPVPSTLAWPFLRPDDIGPWLHERAVDGFTGATPLALMKYEGQSIPLTDLLMGGGAGSIGEAALLILVCGLFLAFKRMLDWRIPVSIMASTALFAWLAQLFDPSAPGPLIMLCSGGLMLGAWFMATDMVGSPMTPLGVLIYGVLIGFVTEVIRLFGGLGEGVMYAILLGNAAAPLIDQWTQPRVFGAAKARTSASARKSA
ncbi:MAG: RnfABCDGE type electron transport complex subunit D [Gammaproteobacteria bacterium]|nr:RnfABCDGE type electron transport complex subunit D [Gammaproteobacteria bacterium]